MGFPGFDPGGFDPPAACAVDDDDDAGALDAAARRPCPRDSPPPSNVPAPAATAR